MIRCVGCIAPGPDLLCTESSFGRPASPVLAGDSRSSCQTPSDCGMFQPALSVASIFPDASGAGYVSMPSPVVTWRGGTPPATGTAQM